MAELVPRLVALAEAIADGQATNWNDAFSGVLDADERAVIRHLRAISEIGRVYSTLSTLPSQTSGGSVSFDESIASANAASQPGALQSADRSLLTSWGSLRLVEKIGRGRFGEVYRAWDPTLHREVALKLLRRGDRATQPDDDLVIEEGRLMARVRHPNVVTIYGAQRIDHRTGLWMELIKGRTLEDELSERGVLAARDIVAIGIDLSRALGAVHDAGLVHRDVKTQNVLREPSGRTVLGDFGTGREYQDGDGVEGTLAGTPAYLAPEIFDRSVATPRSDIYSLGALLFRLATGEYPVRGRSLRELRAAHASGERTPVRAVRPDLPKQIADVIDRALEADPKRRFENALSMEQALASARAGDASVKRSVSAERLIVACVAGVAMLAVGVAAWRGGRGAVHMSPLAPAGGTAPVARAMDARSLRQISQDVDLAGPGAPSPDGRLISFTDWTTGDLAVQELTTGRRWRVTSNVPSDHPGQDRAGTSRFTSDASGLFYVWDEQRGDHHYAEVRWIAVAGGSPRTIWQAPIDAWVYLEHWAGDDRLILVDVEEHQSSSLFVVSIENGSARRALSTEGGLMFGASLSPDAEYLAYAKRNPSTGNHDICIASLDGTLETVVDGDPADERSPVWTSDGRYLLFFSDRSGSSGLWRQRLDGIRAVGTPVQIEPSLGFATFMGLTPDGSLFVRRRMTTREVYVASLDPPAIAVTGEPIRVGVDVAGSNASSDWSPDGRQIAFSRRVMPRWSLVIKSLEDGREHVVPTHDLGAGRPRWAKDSRSVLVEGTYGGEYGLYRVDLTTATVSTVMTGYHFQEYEVLPDGHSIIYANRAGRVFVRRDLRTGREEVMHRVPSVGDVLGLALTREGDRLAYTTNRSGAGTSLFVVDLARPDLAREVFHVAPEERLVPYVFTLAGTEMLVVRSKAEPGLDDDRGALWAIDTETGNARPLDLHANGLQEIRLSPDGHRLSYDEGSLSMEVWALEHAVSAVD